MYGQDTIDGLWVTQGIFITRCSFLAPSKHVPGDHSLVWMDVNYELTFRHIPILPQTFQARCLQLYDTKTTRWYMDQYKHLLYAQGLPDCLNQLCQTISEGQPLTAQQAAEADAVDALCTQAMLTAARKCCKLKMGCVSFSPMMGRPKQCIVFWMLALKHHKGGRVSSNLWRQKKLHAGITEHVRHLSLQDITTRLHQACQEYRLAKQQHVSLCKNFLKSLVTKDSTRLL